MRKISLLGSTGSIGKSTLDVIARHADAYCVEALTANNDVSLMFEQCQAFSPRLAVMADVDAAQKLQSLVSQHKLTVRVAAGEAGLQEAASVESVDTVVAAIVGAAGLKPTMAAVTAGKRILLANKEALVMSGSLFTEAAKASGAVILPVDSEHNAIFQCLPADFTSLASAGISKILLTGSGGPFRTYPLDELPKVSPEQACSHPNWDMGKKISVDSATMMNKGLEFIEACWLFDAKPEDMEIVIHPQSIVHSMVAYADGSVLAQMGQPDMRTPIAHCLSWPERIHSGVPPLDFHNIANLEFEQPDYNRFPCLRLAMDAIAKGGDCPAALNAANEVAVAHFLDEVIAFTDIAGVIASVMLEWVVSEPKTLADVIEADFKARQMAASVIAGLNSES